jgi:hypothetical protein
MSQSILCQDSAAAAWFPLQFIFSAFFSFFFSPSNMREGRKNHGAFAACVSSFLFGQRKLRMAKTIALFKLESLFKTGQSLGCADRSS